MFMLLERILSLEELVDKQVKEIDILKIIYNVFASKNLASLYEGAIKTSTS